MSVSVNRDMHGVRLSEQVFQLRPARGGRSNKKKEGHRIITAIIADSGPVSCVVCICGVSSDRYSVTNALKVEAVAPVLEHL